MKQLSRVEVAKLRQLADFLETVPVEDFALDRWQERAAREPTFKLFGLIQSDPGCGFAGCAIGWAAHSGLFEGLRLAETKSPEWGYRSVPAYAGLTEWRALAKLFGINSQNAEFFFHPDHYAEIAEPADVSDRLRRFAEIVERRLSRQQRPSLRVVSA